MSELENAVAEMRNHPGVEQVLLVGRDGLLVEGSGAGELDSETIAALAPGLAGACMAVGTAAEQGGFRTAVVEWERGVGIVAGVSDDLLLVVLLRPQVGFAALLRLIRERRAQLAEALD